MQDVLEVVDVLDRDWLVETETLLVVLADLWAAGLALADDRCQRVAGHRMHEHVGRNADDEQHHDRHDQSSGDKAPESHCWLLLMDASGSGMAPGRIAPARFCPQRSATAGYPVLLALRRFNW